MTIDDSDDPRPSYRSRIAILPGDPPIAYRPGRLLVDEESLESLDAQELDADRYDVEPVFVATDDDGELIADPPPFGQWYRIGGVENAPATV
ncbi:MAG: hypothetical protein ACM3MM_00940, partial [Acidobacteriota bacterium]